MSMQTIQLEVDMMERSASGKSKVAKRGRKERSKWNIDDRTKTLQGKKSRGCGRLMRGLWEHLLGFG